jgi:hypothetical protein
LPGPTVVTSLILAADADQFDAAVTGIDGKSFGCGRMADGEPDVFADDMATEQRERGPVCRLHTVVEGNQDGFGNGTDDV